MIGFRRFVLSRKVLQFAFLVGVLSASVVESQEWDRFRGPNGSGVIAGDTPAAWTDQDLLWKIKLPGQGHSSPVIWGKRIFLMSADETAARQYVLCVNADDGSVLWQKEFPFSTYHIHTLSSFASTTPAVDAELVYVAWASPDKTMLMAFDHNGEEVWQRELGEFDSQHGFGTSPIVYGDLVILCKQQKKPDRDGPRTPTSFIIAVDKKTGSTRWQSDRMSEVVSYSVPCIFSEPGKPDQLICCSTADGIFSLDPLTGKENWKKEVFSMRTVSSPIVAGDLVLGTTGSGGGGNYVTALRPAANPDIAFEVKRQAPYVPTPVAYQDWIFLWFEQGIVTCVDAKTGDSIWQKRVGKKYWSSPIIVGDKIYGVSEEGDVTVIRAADKFELLAENSLGEASRSTPAADGKRLYFRTFSHLMAVGQ